MVKDEELANDFFHETFVKAITKMHNGQYKVRGKFMFWISRIAHNVIIDHYRDLKSCHIVETPRDKDLQNMKVASVLEMDHERNM
jgi:RNA polymerase sigma-70 factor (ECF subfamily)